MDGATQRERLPLLHRGDVRILRQGVAVEEQIRPVRVDHRRQHRQPDQQPPAGGSCWSARSAWRMPRGERSAVFPSAPGRPRWRRPAVTAPSRTNPIANEPWQLAHSRKTSGTRTRARRDSSGRLRGSSTAANASSPRICGRMIRRWTSSPMPHTSTTPQQGDGGRAAQPLEGQVQQHEAQHEDQRVGGHQEQDAAAEAVVGVGRRQGGAGLVDQVGPRLGQPLVVDVGRLLVRGSFRLRKRLVSGQVALAHDLLAEAAGGPRRRCATSGKVAEEPRRKRRAGRPG